jgi:hypothetical protein
MKGVVEIEIGDNSKAGLVNAERSVESSHKYSIINARLMTWRCMSSHKAVNKSLR